jgi:hypothetical protein
MVSQPYSPSDEWRRALGVAETVKQTAIGLTLEPKHAWLGQVVNEAADQMRNAVLWAASQGSPSGATRESLRPLIIAADAARSDASLASYFLSFLRHEDLIASDRARDIASQLQDVELRMDALSRHLRTELGFEPYEPSPSSA